MGETTFGQRLRLLMGANNFNQQQLSDATGINRSRISQLQNDKVESPQANTIHRLSEFLNCNPIWLETGMGEMFDEEECQDKEYVPTSKRLAYLKGSMTLKAFAQKCGIDEKTITKYLKHGNIATEEHVYKIAKKFKTSLGWLTAGEGWQNSTKKYTGFTLDKHKNLGEKLCKTSYMLDKLIIELEFSYPLEGRLNRPKENAVDCRNALISLRSNLEENFYSDDKEHFDTHIYYCAARLRERGKQKQESLQTQKGPENQKQNHQDQECLDFDHEKEVFTVNEMTHMTDIILRSETIYKAALASNIKAFYNGVIKEDEVKEMKNEIKEIKELLISLGATLPEKRDKAANS